MTDLAQLPTTGATVTLRRAVAADVPAMVDLLSDDPLGTARESSSEGEDLQPYLSAFDVIDTDPAHLLVVGTYRNQVVATMQLSFLPGLARGGATRAQI